MTATARTFPFDIRDLVARLADRAPELAREILPFGVRLGSEFNVAGVDSPLNCSVSVRLTGTKVGVWSAWAAGKSGDALDLIAAVKCDNDKGAAIRWAMEWLRIDPRDRNQVIDLHSPREARSKAADPTNAQKRDAAFRWWLQGHSLVSGDEAFDYLERHAGLTWPRWAASRARCGTSAACRTPRPGGPFPR